MTINTVAEVAGVSKATVSYVLSGKRRISDAVSKRVWETVNELGYRPNSVARSLASRKTHTIGLFCSPTETLREDPYFNQLLSGILDALDPLGYKLTLYPESTPAESDREALKSADSPAATPPNGFAGPAGAGAIDGALIMNPRSDSRGLEVLRASGVSLVVIGTPAEGDHFYVDHDQAALMYLSADYLINKGHRKILFINGPEEYVGSRQRTQGFELALRERGIGLDLLLRTNGRITLEDGERICRGVLESGIEFTAVLTMNDIVAVGAIRALRERGLRCPSDVAVVGSGDTLIAALHSPTLTSITLSPYEQGQEAGAMVIDVIERRRLRPTHTIIPVTMVARESA